MELLETIKNYFLTAAVYWGIDFLWLAVLAKSFYQEQLKSLLRSPVNWPPAALFYTLFPIGVFIFAINPAKDANSLSKALTLGALFGFYTYATYDLSNFATLKNWPLQVVFVDIFWGVFISTITAAAGFYISTRL